MSRARVCEAADCAVEMPPRTRTLFCPDHEHSWVAAGEVPLGNGQVASAVRRAGVCIEEETWVIVRDVYCQRCRQPYEHVRNLPCYPFDTVLRGGPLGIRRRREDDAVASERP